VQDGRVRVTGLEYKCLPEVGRKITCYLESSSRAEETEASPLLFISFNVKVDSVCTDGICRLRRVLDEATDRLVPIAFPSGS
jgi:hypothetical protein